MPINIFDVPKSDFALLLEDYPAFDTIIYGGRRISFYLSTWDTTSLALIERLSKVEWRILDVVFGILRDRGASVSALLAIQKMRDDWLTIHLMAVREYTKQNPYRSIVLVESGSALLDQLEVDFSGTVPNLSLDTWLDYGRTLIASLRETQLKAD